MKKLALVIACALTLFAGGSATARKQPLESSSMVANMPPEAAEAAAVRAAEALGLNQGSDVARGGSGFRAQWEIDQIILHRNCPARKPTVKAVFNLAVSGRPDGSSELSASVTKEGGRKGEHECSANLLAEFNRHLATALREAAATLPVTPRTVETCAAEVKYDRFLKSTSVSTNSPRSLGWSATYPSVVMTVKGGASADQEAILILTAASDAGWRYLRCHLFHMLADGEPVALGESRHSGEVARGSAVIEQIIVPVRLDDLRVAAAAQRIEYRICNDEYVAPEEFLCKLRGFVEAADKVLAERAAVAP